MRYYSKRHYRLVSPPDDTPAEIAERNRHQDALRRARDETAAKFPQITAANVDEALAFQDARIRELTA